MNAIEQAVARTRLAGGAAGERRTFTLARKRAIRKMREFALADPYYYVLELIQAAVAQGATYVKIELGEGSFRLSSTGACFREEELGQLFDFLFAGKDRADLGHVRELALGINALLLFDPKQVTVESGDGTPEGSSRLLLSHGAEEVEVGRAPAPLLGTIVRAEGLHRAALRKKSSLMELPGLPLEASALEERCLTAPVPIVVNDRPLFGYSAERLPRLPGYARSVTIDEGDLYGCVGMEPQGFSASFKLLTFGVWIESVERDQGLGGILCFDRLHKTADHSGIVHDHVWEELWARVRPYAERLRRGGGFYRIEGAVSLLGGDVLTVRELRPFLRAHSRVCLVPPGTSAQSVSGQAALAIGEALSCPVLQVSETEHPWLKALTGPGTTFLSLDLSGDADLPFYRHAARLDPPKRPWLAGEIALPDFPLDELLETIRRRLLIVDLPPALEALRGLGDVKAKVFTPAAPPSLTGLTVRLGTVERLLREWNLSSPFPGQVLLASLPDLPPRALSAAIPVGQDGTRSLGTLLAWELTLRAAPALAEAARLALTRIGQDEEPSPAIRALALSALARVLVTRLSAGEDGRPRLACSVMGEGQPETLLALPLLGTLGGASVSFEQLAERMAGRHGLVYGVLPEVPPALEGLDAHEILSLDDTTERQLLALVGESAYVRIDRREVLAEHRGVLCRDLALGLRTYPDFPLLVEGVDPTPWPAKEQCSTLSVLLDQLVRCVSGLAPIGSGPGQPAGAAPGVEERRQACRHLQWFVCRRALEDPAGERLPGFGVESLPLFLDPEDRVWSFVEVQRALARPEGLTVSLRRALGPSELGLLVNAFDHLDAREPRNGDEGPQELAVSLFLASLLAPLGGVRFALGHLLPHEAKGRLSDAAPERQDRGAEARFLCSVEVSGPGFAGQVGIPADPTIRGEVAVLDRSTDRLHRLPEVALAHGLLGLLRLDASTSMNALVAGQLGKALGLAGERLLRDLIALLAELPPDGPAHLSAALRLLSFAEVHLQLMARPDATVRWSAHHPLAAEVLALPLFPGAAGLLTGRTLLERFCRSGGEVCPALDPGAAPALTAWLGKILHPSRVIRPAAARAPLPLGAMERSDHAEDAPLAAAVEHWLGALRPDLDAGLGADPGQPPRPTSAPFRVVARRSEVFSRFTSPQELLTYTAFERTPTLLLNADHWLFAHARTRAATDPTALAALLLGCFAHVNAALDPITNLHEQIFQRRLMDALERGTLGLVPTLGSDPLEETP